MPMQVILFVVILITYIALHSEAFIVHKRFLPSSALLKPLPPSHTKLLACRRNNKLEKRKRNRFYARRYQAAKGTPTRRSLVIEQKRAIIAAMEDSFVADLFKFTTDDDMPEYTAFSFA